MSVHDELAVPAPQCSPEDDALADQWHRLMRDYSRMTCALDRALAAHDLSSSEFEVLELLARAQDSDAQKVRMTDLAEHAHLSQSALSRLVARLEKDGLAQRTMCDNDRRSVFTSITDEGGRRYRDARPTHRSVLRAEASHCEISEYLCGSSN